MMKKYKATIKNLSRLIFAAVLLLTGSIAKAQTVNITINVLPPYSPYYSDYTSAYASKTLLILQNLSGTQQKVRLTGKLQGDNGILISTRGNYVPAQPIILNPHETKQLNGTTLKSVFDLNSVNVYGIDKAKLAASSRIPEGHYTLCIQAYEFGSQKLLSATAPMGCSMITITNPEPPMLVGPAKNERVRSNPANTVFFNWVNPGTVPLGTQYKVEIAEMPDPAKDPTQVLNSTSLPVLNTIVTGTSYQYSMKDVPFKPGKSYAWRVTALDPSNRVVFRNGGHSPASSFIYDNGDSMADNLQPTGTGKGIGFMKYDYQIGGKLTYQYHLANDKQMPFSKTARRDSAVPLKLTKIELVYGLCFVPLDIHKSEVQNYDEEAQKAANAKRKARMKSGRKDNLPALNTPSDKAVNNPVNDKELIGQQKSATDKLTEISNNNANNKALSSKGISKMDVSFYQPILDSVDQTGALILPATDYSPSNIVATAKTDSNGHYQFNFNTKKACKIIQIYPDQKVAMVMCYYINVVNKQYSDPNSFIYVKPAVEQDESALVDVGTQNVFANNYRLAVMVNRNPEGGTNAGAPVNASVEGAPDDSVQVYLLRRLPHNTSAPLDEVDNSGHTPFQPVFTGASAYFIFSKYEVVAHRQAAMEHGVAIVIPTYNANCIFDNLLDNLKASESYYIYAEYKHSKVYFDPVECSLSPVSDDDYQPNSQPNVRYKYLEIKPTYVSLTVKGVLKYRFNNGAAQPLANTAVVLQSVPFGPDANGKKQYDYAHAKMYDAKVTDSNGYFELTSGEINYDQYEAFNFNGGLGFAQYIKVYSPYYGSSDQVYSFQAGNTYNLGEVISQVKNYNVTVTIKGYNSNDKLTEALKSQRVYLCRRSDFNYKYYGVPVDEGQQSTLQQKTIQDYNGNNYKVVAYGVTNTDGKVTFNRLVVNDVSNTNDKYYVYSESGILTEDNFSTVNGMVVNPYLSINDQNSQLHQQPVFNSIVTSKVISTNVTITTLPQKPYIDGAVYPQSNTSTNALSDALVWLYDIHAKGGYYTADWFKTLFQTSDPMAVMDFYMKLPDAPVQLQKLQQTGDNGLFRFDDPETSDYNGWKLLIFTKYGFITGYSIVNSGIPMGPGTKENVKGFVMPPRLLRNDVVDMSTKKPVKARIVVGDNFSWTDTQSLYIAQGYTEPSEERAYMQTTYGQVKFTVIPDDHVHYKAQTFIRNVNAPTMGLFKAGKADEDYTVIPNFEVTRPVNNITVNVYDVTNNKAIPASVQITQLPPDETPNGYSVKAGEPAKFSFQTNATKYGVKVSSPGYVTKEYNMTAYSDPTWSTSFNAKLQPGLTITGTITVDGVKKGNVGVYIKEMWQTVQEVFTNDQGKYSITGLPADGSFVTVVAANPKGTGASQAVKLAPKPGLPANTTNADFSLNTYSVIDYNNLYGFPLEVESTGKKGSNITITGRVKIPWNNNITMTNGYNNFLTLKDAEVKVIERPVKNAKDKYGNPLPPYILVGASGTVSTVENNVDFTLWNLYHATASGLFGLSLQSLDNDPLRGAVVGTLGVRSNTFSQGVVWKNLQTIVPKGDKYYGVTQDKASADKLEMMQQAQLAQQAQLSIDNNKTFNPNQQPGNSGNNGAGINNIEIGAAGGGLQQAQVFETGGQDIFNDQNLVPDSYFNISYSTPADNTVNWYNIHTTEKKPVKYTLNNLYNAEATADSYLDKSGMHMFTTVHTNIANINNPDLKVNVGELVFTWKDLNYPASSKTDLEIGFDNWKAKGGWVLHDGTIKLTGNIFAGSITVPVSNLEIGPDNIGFGYMTIDKIGIAGVYPLTFGSNAITSFGFDKAAKYGSLQNPQFGAWSLSIVSKNDDPISTITGLPDLGVNDVIKIANISLYSKGDESRVILSNSQPAVTLNGFATFTPYSVDNGASYLGFNGTLDLNIPGISGLSDKVYSLTYKASGNKLIHQQTSLPPLSMVSNGVRVAFDNVNETFVNNQLVLQGHLQDKAPESPYNFKVKMFKNDNKTHKITVTGDPSNMVSMGGDQRLIAIQGNMTGDAYGWKNFTFEGDVVGAQGMRDSTTIENQASKTRMGFEVKGDLVANSSKIGVKNLSFGGMTNGNFTYDFNKKAIVGSFHLDEKTPNAEVHSDFELQLGSGQWYMLGMAKIDHITGTPIPVNGANGAVWIGASDITPGIMSIIQSQFHDGIAPPDFNTRFSHLSGTLMVTAVDMNLPIIPDINLNLGPIASVKVEKGIYANVYTAIGFTKDTVAIDGGIKVGAYVKVHAGASVLVGCAGLNLSAEVNSSVRQHVTLPPYSTFLTLDPLSLLSKSILGMGAEAHVILSGSAYIGFGVCDDDCHSVHVLGVKVPPGCHKEGIGKSMDLGFGVDLWKPAGQLTPTKGDVWVSIFGDRYQDNVNIPGLSY